MLALAPPEAAEKARKYLSRGHYLRGDGLFVWGPLGVGKTALAAVLLMELRRRGHSGLFVDTAELVERLMARDNFDLDTSWAERVREVDVLVLDDLGTEHHDAAGMIERRLETIIRGRLQRKKPTIATCNTAPLRLGPHKDGGTNKAGLYRQKFASVVRESLYPLEVSGPSRRDENAKAMAAGYK